MAPKELLELFRKRQSTRAYDPTKPVDREMILRCIEAARLAPSACNAQPWKFILVDDTILKNALADCTSSRLLGMNHFTKQAPVHLVVVREPANLTSNLGQIIKNKEYPLTDIGIATIQFCLQATAEGLGTCILGWFDEKKVKKLLNIPKNKRAELIITVGYPKTDEIRDKIRKPVTEILSYNFYNH
jgi:nitroreductase